jgi:hypothetical protein
MFPSGDTGPITFTCNNEYAFLVFNRFFSIAGSTEALKIMNNRVPF